MNKIEFLKQLELHKDKFSPDVYEVLCNLDESEIPTDFIKHYEELKKQKIAEYIKDIERALFNL